MINLKKLINLNVLSKAKNSLHSAVLEPFVVLNRRVITSVKRIDVDLFAKLENNMKKNGRIGEKTFYRFFDQLSASPSVSREEGLLLIRSCGSYFIQLSSQERNKLSDKVWSFLIQKNFTPDQSHYNALLNVYLENDYSFDPQKFMTDMINSGIELNRVTYQRLMSRYCKIGDIEGAANILEIMKSKNMPINENVFHSLIVGYSRANDLNAAYNVLDLIKQNGLEPNKDTFKTLLCEYAYHLNEPGIIGKIETVLREVASKEIMWTFADYFEIIKAIAKSNEKSIIIDDLLTNMKRTFGYNLECMNAVIELIHKHKLDAALKLFYTTRPSEILKEAKVQGMYVIDHLIRAQVPKEKVMEICDKFYSSGINEYAYSKAAESALTYCNLETAKFYLDKFCDISGSYQIHYFWPLLCKCKSDDELLKILKEDVAPLVPLTESGRVFDTFKDYVWPHLTSNRIKFFKKCKILGFSEKILLKSLLEQNFRSGSTFDNLKFINRTVDMTSYPNLEHEVFNFLDELVTETKDVNLVKEMFDLIVTQTGVRISNVILGPRIKVHLINDDLEGAISEFINCVTKYRYGPWRIPLMQRLIEKEDTDNLQKITDLCSAIYGEQNILLDLSIAFMSCGLDRQAKKILLTPGLRVSSIRITRTMSKLLKDNSISLLEKFVSLTKDLFEIDRDEQYYYLLKGYIKNENVDKALEIWTLMQEENLSPSPKLLRHLAHFLKLKNVKVPFEIDQSDVLDDPVDERERYTLSKQHIFSYLKENQVDKALSIKADLESNGFKFNLADKCNIMEMLIRKERLDEATAMMHELILDGSFPSPRVYKLLLNELSRAGKFEVIENLRTKLPSAIEQTTWFTNLLVNSYINSGKSNEFFVSLLSELKPFPTGAILPLLKERPELEKPLYALGEEMNKNTGYTLPLNMIWSHYMINQRYEEAEKLFNANPKFKESLIFNPVLEKIKLDKNIDLGLKLIDFIELTEMNPRTKGIVYSIVIDVMLENSKVEEAESLLLSKIEKTKTQAKPITEADFNQTTLLRLYHSVKNNLNRLPNFEIPIKGTRLNDESSPTSASHATDEEETVGQATPVLS